MNNWKLDYCGKFGLCITGKNCNCRAELKFIEELEKEAYARGKREECQKWIKKFKDSNLLK